MHSHLVKSYLIPSNNKNNNPSGFSDGRPPQSSSTTAASNQNGAAARLRIYLLEIIPNHLGDHDNIPIKNKQRNKKSVRRLQCNT